MGSTWALWTARDNHNYRVFIAWLAGAMVVFTATSLLIKKELIANGIGWTLTVLSIVLMLAAVGSYIYFLRNADELLRKIHLDALSLAFGIGAVAMMGYRLCERLGAPKLDINDPFLVMIATWTLAQIYGFRRYAGDEEA